jgi:hypothetical protein
MIIDEKVDVKRTMPRVSTSGFLPGSVSPKPPIMPLRPFRIFPKIRGDIRLTLVANGKNLQSEKFSLFLFDSFG